MSVRRDYKPTPARKKGRFQRRGLLVTTLILIALLGSLLAYISIRQPEPPPVTVRSIEKTVQEMPANQPEPPPRSKYDFYQVLPGREVVIGEDEFRPQPLKERRELPPQRQEPASQTTPPVTGGYMIQAGSFRNFADADRRKASLALLGISSRIEITAGPDNTTWHRVRIGPLKNSSEAQTLRRRLEENDIQSIAIKLN